MNKLMYLFVWYLTHYYKAIISTGIAIEKF